jgi:hypothetical protein
MSQQLYQHPPQTGIVERKINTRTWLEPEVCYAPVNASLYTNNHWYPLENVKRIYPPSR